MPQIGRPPKAKATAQYSAISDCPTPWVDKIIAGRGAITRWLEPREKILCSIGTVGGIAKLAKVDRKTVYRRAIVPGTLEALAFVRATRAKNGNPLVITDTPVLTERLCLVIQFCRELGTLNPKQEAVVSSVEGKLNRKRKSTNVFDTTKSPMADEKINDRIRRGRIHHYNPTGRVTAKQVSESLRISRVAFWKWRKNLSGDHRRIVETAMGQRATNAVGSLPDSIDRNDPLTILERQEEQTS